MYIASQAYYDEQLQELREKSYVYIYMGIINQNARDAAVVSSGLTAYSNSDSAFRKKTDKALGQYATLEENFTRVDATNAFLPRKASLYSNNQGLVTEHLVDPIRITFGALIDVDIKGLTIDFGDIYPTEFTITNGTNSHTYTKSDNSLFTCEDQFDNCSYLDIIPTAMVLGQQRFRIMSLEFGIGLSFDNDNIISTQRRNAVSHVSESLPLKSFDFTIDNISRRFSQDNPKSFANYIQEGQKVEYQYGREIVNGNMSHIEYIPGGKTYIKTWSSNDLTAKFSTVGRLDMMDNEYYKGYYSKTILNQRSAYDCAIEVLTDAGLTSDEYFVSSYLKTIDVINPLPVGTHKACLQMLANMTKSILYEDRDGRISLKSSFLPKITQSNIYLMKAVAVNPNAFDMNLPTREWATLEPNFTRVDGSMYFRGRNNSVLPGIVSDIGFLDFELYFDYQWSFTGLTIFFYEFYMLDYIELTTYRNNTMLDDVFVYKHDMQPVVHINGRFEDVDEIRIRGRLRGENGYLVDEFDNNIVTENSDKIYFYTGEVNRIHISHMIFSNDSGYSLTYKDMTEKPTATSIEKIKSINVNYYSYVPTSTYKQITTVEVKTGENIIKFSNPSTEYRVLWEDNNLQEWNSSTTYTTNNVVKYNGLKYRCTVSSSTNQQPGSSASWAVNTDINNDVTQLAHGAYYLKVNVSTVRGKLVVYGTVMDVSYATYSQGLHDIGNMKKLNNVLIDSAEKAEDISDWLAEHYTNDTEYDISYRGEPTLDCDDIIYLENQFVEHNLCRIEEEEITTAIGMSLNNSMKLRRISYGNLK